MKYLVYCFRCEPEVKEKGEGGGVGWSLMNFLGVWRVGLNGGFYGNCESSANPLIRLHWRQVRNNNNNIQPGSPLALTVFSGAVGYYQVIVDLVLFLYCCFVDLCQ